MTELFICMTQKLINLLNEDDSQRVEQMVQDFKGYNQNGIEVVNINSATVETSGIETVMNLHITSPTITDDIVNEKLKVISTDLQSKGYGDLNISFTITAIYYTPEGVDIRIDIMNFQKLVSIPFFPPLEITSLPIPSSTTPFRHRKLLIL